MKSLALLLSCLLACTYTILAQDGLTVLTQQGLVQGTSPMPTVRRFLGIPYATAKRWQAPQTPPVRKSALRATSFGDSCVQQLSVSTVSFLKLVGGAGLNVTESEDCLSLNIWTPSLRRKQKTAVLLWIYGGGFTFGTSNINTYDGTNFVKNNDDITIVTINYRLNIFGQPNAPQLAKPGSGQNFGLLDVEAAINWVHANIASFGGDPNRISIFGQSAGSVAADAYTVSHPNDNIVKGVILQSGSIAGRAQNVTSDPRGWNAVATAVGCGGDATAAQFTCMQAVPFRTLENAVLSTNATFNIVVDDKTIFSDTATRISSGNFLRVPALLGSTQNEMDVFLVAQALVSPGFTLPTITQLVSDSQTLLGFTCAAGASALSRTKFNIPTWRYQYQGVFLDISTRDDLRAYHAAEIPLVFGTLDSISSGAPSTANEIALSKLMQSAWVAFARDPANGLKQNPGWNVYDPNGSTLVQLGNPTNQSGFLFTKGALVDIGCGAGNVEVITRAAGLLGSLLVPTGV